MRMSEEEEEACVREKACGPFIGNASGCYGPWQGLTSTLFYSTFNLDLHEDVANRCF